MILIGQYDSPFVRRVAIAMNLYGLEFEHRPWSTFGDADKIRPFSPLTRVPVLVLADGDVLLDSHSIIDFIDGLAPVEKRLAPDTHPARRQVFKAVSLATGFADKAVSLFYELVLHDQKSDFYIARCKAQLDGVLAVLEADRAKRNTPFWFGNAMTHADIAVACALRFYREAHPGMTDFSMFPALSAHCERMESLPLFQEISQPFIPPKG